jgi:hypothetical protein
MVQVSDRIALEAERFGELALTEIVTGTHTRLR